MEIWLPILIVAGIGVLAGLGLAVAGVLMAVPVDEKAQRIRDALPGANCGACGFSGCDGYAKALSEGTAKQGLCAPGGEDTLVSVAQILGTKAGPMVRRTAFVGCGKTLESTGDKLSYDGLKTCAAANMFFSGTGQCPYSCLGFGDCAATCPYGAITVCDGVAAVNTQLCKACGQCVSACPKKLISIYESDKTAAVQCHNHAKGGETRKQCSVGCIGCMRCVKVCESDAISVTNFCASVDAAKCTACGKCVEVCPVKCIRMV